MRAALLAKAKAAGPARTPQQEFASFLLWWPPKLIFLMRKLRHDLQGFADIRGAQQRHERELAVLAELRRQIDACRIRSTPFLIAFIDRVQTCIRESMALRRRALAGDSVPADAEEAMLAELEAWLRARELHPDLMGEVAVLRRWLTAWRQARWRQS